MRKIILVLMLLSLTGCMQSCNPQPPQPCPAMPKIDMPERPVLISNGQGDYGTVTKNAEKDLIDLKGYAIQLENLLKTLKSKETINK